MLKTEMIARPFSDRQALPYLVTSLALSSFGGHAHAGADAWAALWECLLIICGTVYLYRLNGGTGSQDFLPRYFALTWVTSVRCLPVIILVGLAIYLPSTIIHNGEPRSIITGQGWPHFLFISIGSAFVYWRIGRHIKAVKDKTDQHPLLSVSDPLDSNM